MNFYTEGSNGFGSDDFGNYVILPGNSLSAFKLTTIAASDFSIAYATDVQYNQDVTTATLPTTVPAAVPEVSTGLGLGTMLALGWALALYRFLRQTRITNQLN